MSGSGRLRGSGLPNEIRRFGALDAVEKLRPEIIRNQTFHLDLYEESSRPLRARAHPKGPLGRRWPGTTAPPGQELGPDSPPPPAFR